MIPRRMKSTATAALMLMSALPFGVSSCFAQASASVTGTVTDPNDANVAGAVVVLTNTNTRETRSAVSSPEGRYTFSLLIRVHTI